MNNSPSPPRSNEDISTDCVSSGNEGKKERKSLLQTTPQPQISNSDSSKLKTPKSVKRIFPGPAGLMCDTHTSDFFSQASASIFNEPPWTSMTQDFTLNNSSNLVEHFNIAWIKQQATVSEFAIQKVPFLAAFLLSLEVLEQGKGQKSVNITLKDPTGSIRGNVLHSLYQEYEAQLKVGALLVLMQAAVLSCTCDKCDNYHLTVTPKSLSRIYTEDEQVALKIVSAESVMSDYLVQKEAEFVKKVKCQSLIQRSRLLNNRKNSVQPPNKTSYPLPKVRRVSELRTKNCDSPVKSKKLFSFKKLPVKENSNSDNLSNNMDKNSSEVSVNLTDSQFSVKADSEEHAEIWKEVLNGLDLSSLFDEDL